MIEPHKNGILFAFIDTFTGKYFDSETKSGIVLRGDAKDSAQTPRWVKILAVGPDVKKQDPELSPGKYACVEPLAWTEGFAYDEIKVWKTDSTRIMLVSDTIPK